MTASSNEWQQVTKNDNELQQVTMNDNEWQRMAARDSEWQQMKANESVFSFKNETIMQCTTIYSEDIHKLRNWSVYYIFNITFCVSASQYFFMFFIISFVEIY